MVNFRKFITSSGLEVFGGKDSANNDELVFTSKSNDILLHTALPGSPFVNVGESPSNSDLKEASVFTAKYSQAWRDGKKDVMVNFFRRCDMIKDRRMKEGSWRVLKNDSLKVKRDEIIKYEKSLKKL